MANNQITPFQLTDQFTMDNFNQRINETNTALQNNDPRNWGLGGGAKALSSSDNFDNITACGWYQWDTEPANGPGIKNGQMIVLNGVYGLVTQVIYNTKGTTVQRSCYYNTWQPWEWINPPMKLGEEYRTTERYLGKPVYVKVIEAGFNPAGTVKTTSDKTVSASGLVRFSAVSGAWSFPSLMYGGNYNDDGNVQVSVQAISDGIYVSTWSKTRDMTSATTNVSVYYTKD